MLKGLKETIEENLEANWLWLLFGVLLLVCSGLSIGLTKTMPPILFAISLAMSILIIIGSIFQPRKNTENNESQPPLPKGEDIKNSFQEQYKQTQENQRFLLRLLWEIPTVAIAISSAFLVAAYNFFPEQKISERTILNLTQTESFLLVNNALIRCILLFFGALLMFVSFLAVVKHRHFRGVWLKSVKDMEKKMNLETVPMFTHETIETDRYRSTDIFHKAFLRMSVEIWLANVLFLISVAFSVLSLVNLYQYLQPYLQTLNL